MTPVDCRAVHQWSVTQTMAALDQRELSACELLTHYLARVDVLNPSLNAVVALDADRAMHSAALADAKRASDGGRQPLLGLPILVKDSIEVAGLRTTAGSKTLQDFEPESDAPVVAQLRDAGAIVFGKTNLPEFAADSQTYNDLFGQSNNPWDLERTPGGSSGGAAAAVSAGLTALDIGSDLGGSLRIPAHFCGVATLKPTWGVVSSRGHIPPEPGVLSEVDICALGPIVRSTADLDLVLGLMTRRSTEWDGWKLNLPEARKDLRESARIAIWFEDPAGPVSQEIRAVYRTLSSMLHAAGMNPIVASPPIDLGEALLLAQRLIQGMVAAWVPKPTYDELARVKDAAGDDETDAHVRFARNITQSARELTLVAEQRTKLKAAVNRWFDDFDALLTPVMPVAAFAHDHNPDVGERRVAFDGGEIAYNDMFAWLQAFGALHLPVAVVPVGLTATGLPVGIQIVGREFADRTVIAIAAMIEAAAGGPIFPPAYL